MTMGEVAKRLSEVTAILFKMPCTDLELHGQIENSCIQREDERPLTKKERDEGWTRRPFSTFDPDRMCLSCAAYWHAEMAGLAAKRADAAIKADAETPKS